MKKLLDLEDDLAIKLDTLAQATGLPVDKVLNNAVREGLAKVKNVASIHTKPFRQETHKMGWYAGMTWEKIQEMLLEEEAQEYRRSEEKK